MKKLLLFFLPLTAFLVILSSCQQEKYLLCPDNVTSVIDLKNCPIEKPKCPLNCTQNETCMRYFCNAATNYSCKKELIKPCDGNGLCEQGEFGKSKDCIAGCDDNDTCTADDYNYALGACTHPQIMPCCGNNNCETGETYVNCQLDCKQTLEIKVTRYEPRQTVNGAYRDLTGTDYTYLIVYFKIRNINIITLETLDYRKQNGFYYDPFKMKLEDSAGRKYDVEYDSDMAEDWRDPFILPRGDTVSASLMFIVPLNAEHLRLVAYDKYGSRMDISEVY